MAQLCTLRLLHTLRAAPPTPAAVRCIVFGCPPVGNAALAAHVEEQQWEDYFQSIMLPGE